mgnify:CR=1 FL=1
MKNNDFTINELIRLSIVVDARIASRKESLAAFKDFSNSGDYDKHISSLENEISEYTVISEKIAYKRGLIK